MDSMQGSESDEEEAQRYEMLEKRVLGMMEHMADTLEALGKLDPHVSQGADARHKECEESVSQLAQSLASLRQDFMEAVSSAPAPFPFQLNSYMEQAELAREVESVTLCRQVMQRHCQEMGLMSDVGSGSPQEDGGSGEGMNVDP